MLCKIKGILNKPLKVLSSKLELLVNLNVFQRVTHELLQEHVTQCIRVSRERFHRARVLVFHAHLASQIFTNFYYDVQQNEMHAETVFFPLLF